MSAVQQDIFYNTISLKGEDLQVAKSETLHQNDVIRMVFEKYPHQEFTPADIHKILTDSKYKFLLTSIRRGITTLQQADKLTKTGNQKMGAYGKKNYTWQLKNQSYAPPIGAS